MIFFFDRNIGTRIPKALQSLKLPVDIEYHEKHFPMNEPDDRWLPIVGGWDWTVIAQDYKFHLLPNELYALKQYEVGVFYLWGANATRWETVRVFARAYDRIVAAAATTPKPFVYRIYKDGRLRPVTLP